MSQLTSLFRFPLETHKRVYGLDIMRTIAILLVMLSHGRQFLVPMVPQAQFLHIGGFLGVELFFVLSGFLIGTILLKVFTAETKPTFATVRSFWIRRWFRTLPNYYLVLGINLLLAVIITHEFPLSYLLFIPFLQNFAWPHPVLFGEAWSLSVEEWFYLTFPVVALGFYFILPRLYQHGRVILSAIIFFLVAVFLIRLFAVLQNNPPWDTGVRKIVLFRLDTIIWGVLMAYIKFYHEALWKKYSRAAFWLSLLLFVPVVYYYYTDVRAAQPSLFSKTVYFTLVSVAGALMLPLLSGVNSKGSPTLLQKGVTLTSVISYSLYLVHLSLVVRFTRVLLQPDSVALNLLAYLIFWVGSYLLSCLLFKYFEKPCMDLRERFALERK